MTFYVVLFWQWNHKKFILGLDILGNREYITGFLKLHAKYLSLFHFFFFSKEKEKSYPKLIIQTMLFF